MELLLWIYGLDSTNSNKTLECTSRAALRLVGKAQPGKCKQMSINHMKYWHLRGQKCWIHLQTPQISSPIPDLLQNLRCSPGPTAEQPLDPANPSFLQTGHRRYWKESRTEGTYPLLGTGCEMAQPERPSIFLKDKPYINSISTIYWTYGACDRCGAVGEPIPGSFHLRGNTSPYFLLWVLWGPPPPLWGPSPLPYLFVLFL